MMIHLPKISQTNNRTSLGSTETDEPTLSARLKRLLEELAEINEKTQSEDHKEKNKAIAVMHSFEKTTNTVSNNSITECHNYEKFLKPTMSKSFKFVPSASIGEMQKRYTYMYENNVCRFGTKDLSSRRYAAFNIQ